MLTEREVGLVIIGGGPAGLAAAIAAKEAGVDDLVVVERDHTLGGILKQCVHDGFGLDFFKEALTGPEYAERFVAESQDLNIPVMLRSSVVDLTPDKVVTVWSPSGFSRLRAGAVILSMGCRERTRGQIRIPGTRPAGIYTAGVAQYLVNVLNYMVGRRVVILGSGDIGLIMARRLTLEGAEVPAVVEIKTYPSGLPRNIAQCLNDFSIPLLLGQTVTRINGANRVESVLVAEVDASGTPVLGTEREIACDTLLLSVGLIPENELSKKAGVRLNPATAGPVVSQDGETNVEGIFACGNVAYVHDIVDQVTVEAQSVGKAAASYLKAGKRRRRGKRQADTDTLGSGGIAVKAGQGIAFVFPQRISRKQDLTFCVRPSEAGSDRRLVVREGDRTVKTTNLKRVYPAQTINVRLKAEQLKGISYLELMLEDGSKGSAT